MSSRVGIQQFISPTEPTGTQVGDEWFNSATNVLYKRTLNSGVLGWVILGTSNTTGTAGQSIGITSAGVPGFIPAVGAATPTAVGTVFGCTQTGCLSNMSLGFCANALSTSTVGCWNLAIGWGALCGNVNSCANVAIGPMTLQQNYNALGNVAIGTCVLKNNNASWNTAVGYFAMQNPCGAGQNVAIGAYGLQNGCLSCFNTVVGAYAGQFCTGLYNVAIGHSTMRTMQCGDCNIAIGYGALYSSSAACNTIGIGWMAMRNATTSCNIAIGQCAGCAITTGLGNVILGSYIACAAAACTVAIQAGNCLRLYIDNAGLQVNGATVGGAGGGSGIFNTSVSCQIGYALVGDAFTTTFVTTSTVGVIATMPATTSTRFLVHSLHITNTAASDAEVTGRFELTLSNNPNITTATVDHVSFFASRLPVPSGSSVELLKKPQVLYPNDIVRLQATSAAGGGGVNGQLYAYMVYESSTDVTYQSSSFNLSSTSPTNIYTSVLNTGTTTSTSLPSVIESIRVTNYSNAADYRVSVIWTNSANVVQSYLAYNMLIPAFATVELCEKVKRITAGDIIKAVPEAPNVLSIQVSAKIITSTSV